MQEQPIEQELQEIKRRLTRLERHTEPIQITRLEIESGSLYRRMDDVQESTNSTQTKIDSVREDVLKIRESQADLRDRLREQSDDLKAIKEKQEAHTELLGQLIGIGESHTARFDRIDGSIAELRSAQVELRSAQAEHTKRFDRLEGLMMRILERLPKAEGE